MYLVFSARNIIEVYSLLLPVAFMQTVVRIPEKVRNVFDANIQTSTLQNCLQIQTSTLSKSVNQVLSKVVLLAEGRVTGSQVDMRSTTW